MKCTDFRKELDLIHQKELKELTAALESHGGEYEFADGEEKSMDDYENYPEVTVDSYCEWRKFRVMKAFMNDGDPWLSGKFIGENGEEDYIEDVDADSVMTGDMLYIISMMDEPGK